MKYSCWIVMQRVTVQRATSACFSDLKKKKAAMALFYS